MCLIISSLKQRLGWVTIICVLLGTTATVTGADIVRLSLPHSNIDQRHVYGNAVLKKALELTIESFGPFEIRSVLAPVQRKRALAELVSGKGINAHIVPTQPDWETQAIAIRIPIAKGLLGYRLLLIHKKNKEKFAGINSLAELKALRAGLRQQWTLTKAMEKSGFNLVKGSSYEGLFRMLSLERFDFFPRGVNEIFQEMEGRQEKFPDLMIAPGVALYIPLPVYIFISPQYPLLAKRVEKGLGQMLKDGSLNRLFFQFYRDSIKKAELADRRIFRVDNPLLPPVPAPENPKQWYEHL